MKISFLHLFVSMVASLFLSTESFTAELSTLLQPLKSMRADFSQTIYDNRGKAVQKTYGRMALKRPGQFRWEVTRPIPQLIVANNTRLWIYDRDLQQLTIRSLEKTAGVTPALLLSQVNTDLENKYNIKVLPGKSGLQWFELTPKKSEENMLSSTEIGFLNNQIQEMRLKDHLDHTTHIKFQHIETNSSLPASLFTLKTPKNVDVIDETRKKK